MTQLTDYPHPQHPPYSFTLLVSLCIHWHRSVVKKKEPLALWVWGKPGTREASHVHTEGYTGVTGGQSSKQQDNG